MYQKTWKQIQKNRKKNNFMEILFVTEITLLFILLTFLSLN
jgi:uncharacterized membrane protein YqjE